jgi:NTP pyrophosphatase (non-canonical NTP hydrolase)
MIEQSYGQMVEALAKPGAEILRTLTPEQANLLHMALGVCGEAGELADAIKKHAVYNKPLDVENVIEELGDLEFYMEGVRRALNILRATTIAANVCKLSKRYHLGRYSNEQAQTRADKGGAQ